MKAAMPTDDGEAGRCDEDAERPTGNGNKMKVVLVDYYGHGVLWAVLEAENGQKTTVCIDDRSDSPTRGRLFIGGRHPLRPEAVLIDIGDEREGEIVSLLSHWCDDGANWSRAVGALRASGALREEFRETMIRIIVSLGSYTL